MIDDINKMATGMIKAKHTKTDEIRRRQQEINDKYVGVTRFHQTVIYRYPGSVLLTVGRSYVGSDVTLLDRADGMFLQKSSRMSFVPR